MIEHAIGLEPEAKLEERNTRLVHDLRARGLAALAPASEPACRGDRTAEGTLGRGIHASGGLGHRPIGGTGMRRLLGMGRILIAELAHAVDESERQ